MRNRYQRRRFALLLLTALTAAASGAQAGDVVVMPFRCAVVDGKPVLTPSDEMGHRVLGKLETQKVKTCSTVDPKRCRQWATFKFDMDCGGVRVPWMQVFANASDFTRRRVWERNGSLRVQDTPRRSKRIDDMCARRMDVNQEWWSVNQICDEVSPINTPKSTDMPAGFAPMVGLDAVFLPGEVIGLPPARMAKALPAAAERAETASIQAAPQAKPAAPAPMKSAVATPAPAPAETPRQPQMATAQEPVAREAVNAQPPVSADPVPVAVPEVVRADSPTPPESLPGVVAKSADSGPPAPAPAPVPTPVAAVAVNAVEAASGAAHVATELETAPAENGVASIILALAGGFLLAVLALVKWLGRADTSEAPPRAQGSRERPGTPPSLGTSAPMSGADRGQGTARSGTALAVTPRHHITSGPTGVRAGEPHARTLSIGDRMPSSKHEALELLGMGVASESNLGSLKKIIDGLRMNWHPDLARNEMDRQERELRLKQINAAWDILGGKAA